MNFHMIERSSPEWEHAWNSLDAGYSARECSCGERWQYMDTTRVEGEWVHQFRHRCGSAHGMRTSVNVAATAGYQAPVLVRKENV